MRSGLPGRRWASCLRPGSGKEPGRRCRWLLGGCSQSFSEFSTTEACAYDDVFAVESNITQNHVVWQWERAERSVEV